MLVSDSACAATTWHALLFAGALVLLGMVLACTCAAAAAALNRSHRPVAEEVEEWRRGRGRAGVGAGARAGAGAEARAGAGAGARAGAGAGAEVGAGARAWAEARTDTGLLGEPLLQGDSGEDAEYDARGGGEP